MLPPITFRVQRGYLPLRVQAGIVTNKGTDNIYLFGVDDDVPVSGLAMLTAFAFCILCPGQSVDIEANPHIGYLKNTDRDKCITIHADTDIEVDIESNDLPTSWSSDQTHPWNGGKLPSGLYTEKFKGAGIVKVNTIAPTTITMPNAQANPNVISVKVTQPLHWIEVKVNIDCGPKCTCGEKSNRHPGKCSWWCDLEKAKDKNV